MYSHSPCERVVPLHQGEHQIEFRGLGVRLHRFDAQSRQVESPQRRVLQDEHRLEQGTAARIASRLQFLDEFLERQILVCVRVERRLAHAGQQGVESRIAGKIGAQHQGVDEKSDEALGLQARAVGDGRSDAQIALAAVAHQQDLESREQNHEQGRAGRAPQSAQSFRHRFRHFEIQGRAAVALDRRTRMVCRQLQGGRRPLQLAPPIAHLGFERLALQPAALPAAEIGILNRQLWQIWRLVAAEGRIQGCKVADEDVDRPAVGDDVMEHEGEDMVFVAELDQRRPRQRPAREVEGPSGFLLDEATHFRFPSFWLEAAKIDASQRRIEFGRDLLARLPVPRGESGAEDFMALRQPAQAGLDRRDVQIASQAQGGGHAIETGAGLELVEEPQALLREGQRHDARVRRCFQRRRDAAFVSRARFLDERGQGGDGRSFEQASQRQIDVEVRRIREITWVARSECPPSSKKSSRTPTRAIPSTSAQSALSSSSVCVRGGAWECVDRPPKSGAGSALRSTFPFAVNGSESMTTNADGTI